ncbi:hypothetical protein SAMN05421783_15014 [Thiocapsa roseopersicina]|uniref:Uncharacterized protein n=1 Tax=Thiocapsa roseopersicina TaxID=1058 RepID=A0A1H3DJE6_THIRO|nr:hypothetical protein SAMN05421783_15014 [Thiocapsa roseopersicina]
MRSAIGWPSWFLATAATKGAVSASVVRASRGDTPAPIDAVDFDHPGQLQLGVALELDLQKLVPDAPGRGVGKTSRWMVEREAATVLCGTVQVDDAYLGVELVSGTAGRGSENKVPFIAAVSVNDQCAPVSSRCPASPEPPSPHEQARTSPPAAPSSPMAWPASPASPTSAAPTSRPSSGRQIQGLADVSLGQYRPRQHQERLQRGLPQL